MIQRLDMAALTHLVPVYRGKLRAFVTAFESEESLRDYLSHLCGNSEYRLPKTYAELRADLEAFMEDSLYAEFHEGLKKADEWVTLSVEPDGSYIAPLTSTSVYAPDGRFEELRSLITTFLSEFDETLDKGLSTSSAPYPPSWENHVRQAVELKRRGQFLASAKIYVDLSRTDGTVYTGTLNALYKTVASAGDLLNGNFILMRGQNIYRLNPHSPSVAAGIASNFADHLSRMIAATESRARLEDYLRSICGNPRYYLPRDYEEIGADLRGHYAKVSQMVDDLQKTEKRANGGCYIATAVYGTYDAPSVLVLRRFRDENLAHSVLGRAFINAYYAVGPTLAKHISQQNTIAAATRHLLDRVVLRLESRDAKSPRTARTAGPNH